MRSVRAIYENGKITFPQGDVPQGKGNVIVTFLDDDTADVSRPKDAGKEFVREWRGVIEGSDIGDWKTQKAEYLKGKSG